MACISVIVPVYKVEPYLSRCVDSILAQTFTDFELILVDDGSPDNCGVICDEYAQKDARIRVIHQENGGLSAARNAGIDWAFAHSDSQWLSFVDSDDWVHPQMLEQLYRAVQEHDVDVSICGYRETDGDDPWEEGQVFSKLWPVEKYYVEHNVNATVAWGKLYHRDCFKTIRYPVGRIHEDEYVTYRILFEYAHVAVIDSPMYAYYVNLQGITKSGWTEKRLDAVLAVEEQCDYFKKRGLSKAYHAKIKSYAYSLCALPEKIEASDEPQYVKKRALRKTKQKLGLMLITHKKNWPFIQENLWLYETAFPRLMNIYWYMCAIGRRIKKLAGR